jgi:hypothetical protein
MNTTLNTRQLTWNLLKQGWKCYDFGEQQIEYMWNVDRNERVGWVNNFKLWMGRRWTWCSNVDGDVQSGTKTDFWIIDFEWRYEHSFIFFGSVRFVRSSFKLKYIYNMNYWTFYTLNEQHWNDWCKEGGDKISRLCKSNSNRIHHVWNDSTDVWLFVNITSNPFHFSLISCMSEDNLKWQKSHVD